MTKKFPQTPLRTAAMLLFALPLAVFVLLAGSPTLAKQDTPLDGKTLYAKKLCKNCHGIDGKNPLGPMYTVLAGQTKAYLLNQMKDIRDGKREGLAIAMKAMVHGSKDKTLDAIADYLSKIPLPKGKANGSALGKALYTSKRCNRCHGDDATKPLFARFGKLATQQKTYLLRQMKAIRDGKRTNGLSNAMRAVIKDVTDKEFDAIADYLSKL